MIVLYSFLALIVLDFLYAFIYEHVEEVREVILTGMIDHKIEESHPVIFSNLGSTGDVYIINSHVIKVKLETGVYVYLDVPEGKFESLKENQIVKVRKTTQKVTHKKAYCLKILNSSIYEESHNDIYSLLS